MTLIFRQSMDGLRRRVLHLGGTVEGQVERGLRAVEHRDLEAARAVLARRDEVNRNEQDIEEECLHLMALYQPVAFDLRMLTSILKMTGQLRRIDDLAVDLAHLAELISQRPGFDPSPFDLSTMGTTTREMLRRSLDSVLDLDVAQARRVREMDDVVDRIHREMYDTVCEAIRADPEQNYGMIVLTGVARKIERIADYACGIAKDVLYLASGEIVRHEKHPPAGRRASSGDDAAPRDEPADEPDASSPQPDSWKS